MNENVKSGDVFHSFLPNNEPISIWMNAANQVLKKEEYYLSAIFECATGPTGSSGGLG
jgi:hypothetical protein